jgi:hypothetical protein
LVGSGSSCAFKGTSSRVELEEWVTRPAPLGVHSFFEIGVVGGHEAVKIFMPANREKPVYAPYVEHVPPDDTACIFWLKNRDPQHWRSAQEHVLGKYIIATSR